ncbi:protein of unknown function DUF477 [Caldicellulosiruptor owensensis OL]|uniref:TPM domain-containing protein n=1 Tax=Caldicellulosiruptor owensensis (strain ATCC 700167 / DSM 13100 / OL) TaxID=632518 RepID=E4Q1T7_CALOW|nr:TPM domain-containing protein [Caldicellulosiruptor owensensis]ADQ03636.1 protein of unknown function DUF477 [Caldicellulosiruptor owensensis OL]
MKINQGLICRVFSAVFIIAVSSFLITSFTFSEVQVPKKPGENIYVFDYANLIDSSDEEEMRALAREIEDKSKAEIIVVTVETLGSYTIEEYANKLFKSWGIGDKKLDNGVLILVNRENLLSGKKGRIRIEVGYGLEGAIPDGKAGRILDEYALPAFENKEYSKGIKDTFFVVAGEVAKEYGVEINSIEGFKNYESEHSNDKSNAVMTVFVAILIGFSLLITGIVILLAYKNPKLFNDSQYTMWQWEKRIYFKDKFDKDDEDDNDDSFKWFGGGSSGGGFGGFGGGSSGGGGASR